MARTVTVSNKSFETIIRNNYFYIDKTQFIKEWWESGEELTLITRPRCFGKTLTMDMIERFFSLFYKDKPEPFLKQKIGKDTAMMKLQGTIPVIFLTFMSVEGPTFDMMLYQMR